MSLCNLIGAINMISPGSYSQHTLPDFSCDDAYSFAPSLVIDIKNVKFISIDYRMCNPREWKDLIRRNHHVEDDANYYKFYF